MKKTHPARHVLLLIFSLPLLLCLSAAPLLARVETISILKETAERKEMTIPVIGIKKAFLYNNEVGVVIAEVDKQGPLRWMMRDTRIISITWSARMIQLDEWGISMLGLIKEGQEIFVHYLLPGETDEQKIETRQVDIRFSTYLPPDYIDYSSP